MLDDLAVCRKCGAQYVNLPERDEHDGSYYCFCGGGLVVKEADDNGISACYECGKIVVREYAYEGDYGECICGECWPEYEAEILRDIEENRAIVQKRTSLLRVPCF